MFSYILLTFISQQFGLNSFTTKYVFNHIDKIFKISEVAVVQIIEENLCQALSGLTKEEIMDAFGYNEDNFFNAKYKEETIFPWEYFTGDIWNLKKNEYQKGRSIIIHPYPGAYNIGKFGIKNKDTIIKDLNIPMRLVRKHFQFEDYSINQSREVLTRTEQDFRKRKKLKRKKPVIFVGIHHRRGDHIIDQVMEGVGELSPGYFLGAMDFFREKYKNVVFLYVSDDMEWGKLKLLPR